MGVIKGRGRRSSLEEALVEFFYDCCRASPASALTCCANKNIICAKKDDLHEMKTLALALTDASH